MSNLEKFQALGLSCQIIESLKKKGFEEPTEIQSLAIPFLLKEAKDLLGQAQTGTGKTGAFSIPVIEKLLPQSYVQCVILAPTRELAIQITEEINSISYFKKLVTTTIYGGQPIDRQIERLKRGVDIIVATPGRMIDHLERKTVSLSKVQYAILDEADEMLNMGFVEDIEKIISFMPKDKKTMLFSATMPRRIMDLAKKYMNDYEIISTKKIDLDKSNIKQIYFEVGHSDKFEALYRIIDLEESFYSVIFCRTRADADDISEKLRNRNLRAEALHGDVSQGQREKILTRFKKKSINILVATDVAARGIDVNDLTHVINYSLPMEAESYTHRIGRTGRAGKSGTAITLITPSEFRKLMYIKKSANHEISKQEIPGVKEIIQIKKNHIISEIDKIIEENSGKNNIEISEMLLEKHKDNKIIISALLKIIFKNNLDEDKYRELSFSSGRGGGRNSGATRLFVAKGKKDAMNAGSLAGFISDNSGVVYNKIDDIKILDSFSFISVSAEDAEIILNSFKSTNGRSIVSRAKENNNRSFGGRDGGGRSFGSRGGKRSFDGRNGGGKYFGGRDNGNRFSGGRLGFNK